MELEYGYDIETVKKDFLVNLKHYLKTEKEEVKYAEIGATLINTKGVWDYRELRVNEDIENIVITEYCVAVSEQKDVTFL